MSRLYRGDKRLVFCDSRSKVEDTGEPAATAGGQDLRVAFIAERRDRRAAEAAFAEERDCVIVATSTLELGIDVGRPRSRDPDRCPVNGVVAASAHGPDGTPPGMPRNCTFLATDDEALLTAAALCRLLAEGYTEPIDAPAEPWHIVAQQAMALLLERRDLARNDLTREVQQMFPELPEQGIKAVLDEMLELDILWEDEGLLWFGERGEREFGGRNFLDLVSSFTTPPLLSVQFGATELGFVDPVSVSDSADGEPAVLSLGGRGWRVQSVDLRGRTVWVEPAADTGRSQWLGSSRALSAHVTGAMKKVLVDGKTGHASLSRRATVRLQELRTEFAFLEPEGTSLVRATDGSQVWWTFAGSRANALLASATGRCLNGCTPRWDALGLYLPRDIALDRARLLDTVMGHVELGDAQTQFGEDLKFSSCLRRDLLDRCVRARLLDQEAAVAALEGSITYQTAGMK